MLEVFSSPFMQKAFMAGILVSLLTGLISVFIVLRKMSFVGAGISHAAFGGVAIGFFIGVNPLLTAIVYSIMVAIGIESTGRKGRISEDVSIGIFYSVSMALGVALVSLSGSYNVDLFGYLFGNILAISQTDILPDSHHLCPGIGFYADIFKRPLSLLLQRGIGPGQRCPRGASEQALHDSACCHYRHLYPHSRHNPGVRPPCHPGRYSPFVRKGTAFDAGFVLSYRCNFRYLRTFPVI